MNAVKSEQPRADRPGPLLRRGPRPLLLHLLLAWMRSAGSPSGWPNWNGAWLPQNLGQPPASVDSNPAPDIQAVGLDDAAMIAGIAAYRRHPGQRTLSDPPAIWQEGEARLLDYAPASDASPVLFVPSLINRGYILDLAPEHSLMRFLAARGQRPLLLDWGWPGPVERTYTLTNYIAGPLERALAASGRPATLVGYCMGGLLAVAAAQRRPDLVQRLALLATPWDFRVQDAAQSNALASVLPMLGPILDGTGTVPIDVLQSLFALLDPPAVAQKFRRFGRLDQGSDAARLFVAIEDWANDGVPLAAAVARECFSGWYGANAPMAGTWRVAGACVTPAALRMPAFVAIPGRDRIVPPASARPLAALLAHATVIEPATGHVGMMAGRGAEDALWAPLLTWLAGAVP